MSSKGRRFSGEQKAKIALEALRGDRTLQEIASKHQVHPNQVGAWKRQAVEGLGEVFSNGVERHRRAHESELRELSVGRSSLYYTPKGESAETLARMRPVDERFLKSPFYGARQMARLMRLLGLQALYRAPRTSDPHPEHRVWPYLVKGMTIERANHVWCADITSIPVRRGFLYLVAIMDWASRHILAWRLSNTRWTRASVSRRWRRPWRATARRRYSTPTKAASSPASPSPGACRRPAFGARWTGAAGAWTTSSSSGCSARFHTRRSMCTRAPTASPPGASSANGSAFTTPSGRTRRWAGERRRRPTEAARLWIGWTRRSVPCPHLHRRNSSSRKTDSRGFWPPERQPEYTLTQPPGCPTNRGHLTPKGVFEHRPRRVRAP